ncbi:MAG: RNA-binding protein [Gammaproteobacteria bacterium]|nr:RNA-binding protein [Gammaproteobacteria bacterium]
MKIYIGNMPYSVTSEELSALFEAHGRVQDAQVIADRETGRSKGFGFIDMPDNSEADEAIKALNGTQLKGRQITVNQARPRRERTRRY